MVEVVSGWTTQMNIGESLSNFKDYIGNINKFKSALKHFLHTHKFYNLDEFPNKK